MELGKKQMLTVVKVVDFGVYLGDDRERFFFRRSRFRQESNRVDPIEVFLYKDSSDRLIATVNEPEAYTGGKCNPEGSAGWQIRCFLDWGLEKDLFLPFKEQTYKVNRGMNVW